SRAARIPARIRSALPAMSPTVAFIWQRAKRMIRLDLRVCRLFRGVGYARRLNLVSLVADWHGSSMDARPIVEAWGMGRHLTPREAQALGARARHDCGSCGRDHAHAPPPDYRNGKPRRHPKVTGSLGASDLPKGSSAERRSALLTSPLAWCFAVVAIEAIV